MAEAPRMQLPWLAPAIERALAMPKAHALLLHGAPGDGLYECAQAITHAWLCEAGAGEPRPCGHCGACRLLAGGMHPDLHRLLPEELRLQLGVQAAEAGEGAEGEGGTKGKRKPSRQIRIDEVRAAIDWVMTTSSRGRAKVVLVHPAETMNVQSANALLKTLEEPPRGARLLLTAAEPAQLLPTVRSRCQVVRLAPPPAHVARGWLQDQGLAQPDVLLAACSQRPLDALAMAAAGIDAARWAALPAAVLERQAAVFAGWTVSRVIDTLLKLCHDGLSLAAGGPPRFFPLQALQRPASAPALAAWSRELARQARHADHPWNEGLLIDALLARASAAWAGRDEASDTLAA
jgi:DNA polymerase-3 subunit delta'